MVRAFLSRIVLSLLVMFLSAASLAGCKGNCRQLSERLCDCSTNTLERDACLRRASSSDNAYPSADEDDYCGEQLAVCDCQLIDTPEGKRRCGLSRE